MRSWGRPLFTFLAIWTVLAAAGRAAPPAPELAPIRAFTPAMAARIDKLAQDEIAAGRTPGLAVGVVEDGRLVYSRGFGFANLDKSVKVEPDTQFYVGALTMQFTAAAVMMLEQSGKLKLDDKVVKYVPELTVAPDVTIAQLLQQTSGLPDVTKAPGISIDRTRSIKLSDVIAAIDKLKPAAPAGTVYANNPLNYSIAGLVIERASGEPLSDYLQEQIFLPLVMDRTFLAGDNGISPLHAVGYTRGDNGRGFVVARPWDPSWLGGAQGLVTTVYDLAKWDIEMPILVRIDAVRTIFTPGGNAGPTQYGMGWIVDRRGGRRFVWYNGEIPGYRATNALLPDDHVAVIVLANVDSMHPGRPPTQPEMVTARILDVVAPPATARLDNTIVTRAKEWLQRLAEKQLDRTQLTASFSTYLTDDLVARENFASLGKLQTIVPISSTTESNGDTLYEFLVQFTHARYHYKFAVTRDGKIDEIVLVD